MKIRIRSAALLAAFAVLAATSVTAGEIAREPVEAVRRGEPVAGWIVDRADNICGLDDAKMLSKPAKVDYDALIKATPELKKIKDDKIDPNSPQGIQLRQAAATRVQTAAEKVRTTEGHCSVWKTIKHSDGRAVADITETVKAQL
ncbi:MAG: hypothetical protein ACKVXR_13495 [Planctomycetota bacterium]